MKALKAEGYRIVLVNSNPATIMTDPDLADATYIEPITPDVVARIIEKERTERPGDKLVLLPTMGGQTALNTALSLNKMGVLEKYGIELIGAKAEAIDKAEDRELFREAMKKIGLETPKSMLANASAAKDGDKDFHATETARLKASDCDTAAFEQQWAAQEPERLRKYRNRAMVEAFEAMLEIGLPCIIRPSFTLGGTGGGIAYNREEFFDIVEKGLDASPTAEVLIEESVLGWKEYEMEVVRDKDDNRIIICSIENVDPMGVHTGDSITVAPALTLTDKEYQIMRNASIAVLREIGIETGGSNVQFGVNPADGRLVVIEMNPRVSRSSALASKATGFPIAKVAAKLAVGYTLDELANDITGGATPAAFEPTIDYVVTKIPRFAFEKFPGAEPILTTAMKSVGEVMAIGRTFQESVQKALRGLETGLTGFNEVAIPGAGEGDDRNAIRAALGTPTPDRLLKIAQAFRMGATVEQIFASCKYEPWFLRQIEEIVRMEETIRARGLPKDAVNLRRLKAMGFSDQRLGELVRLSEDRVRAHRHKLGVRPAFKRIDTCAGEFASPTPYMYSTYERGDEARPTARDKVIILGGGPNRIGQGIEFDYCCCHACFALHDAGYESIMVNCNPETVSTDYDTSDRLYFEPLTAEDVLEIIATEQSNGTLKGVIVQFGGQTPLKLAGALEAVGVPILGTTPEAIDLAEDRDRFARLIRKLKLRQPVNGMARSGIEAKKIAKRIGFPVVIRPSYVLGGRAMEIVRDDAQLDRYITEAVVVSGDSPVLIDSYLANATEVDVDVIADGRDVFIAGVMEHIEEAGIHSGDSACSLPPYSLKAPVIAEMERQARDLALALKVVGLMNVQFAVKDDLVYVLEVNPRASRTVPFVAKVIGLPVAKIAARVMAGEKLADFKLERKKLKHVAVKEAVFPFNRFPGVDVLLGPEMRSTGEVMGIDMTYDMAFAKSQLGAGMRMPQAGTVFVSVKDADKPKVLPAVKTLIDLGFNLVATGGTQRFFEAKGVPSTKINKVLEGRPHVVDAIKNGEIQLVLNTTETKSSQSDSKPIRQTAMLQKVPYYTTLPGILAVTKAIAAQRAGKLDVKPLQEYFS